MLLLVDMKKVIYFISILLIGFIFTSCGSTPVEEVTDVLPEIEETVPAPVEETVIEDPVIPEIKETPVVEVLEPEIDEEEYIRSTNKINANTVSKNQFAKDKTEILKKIEELQVIMNTKDFSSWLDYIAPESKKFYSKPRKIVSNRGLIINNGLEDYFLNIFIPAREQSSVQEIRYVSPENIKAVEVLGAGKIKIYYYFVKVEDKWYVELPTDIVLK